MELDALLFQLSAVLESCNLKVQPFVGKVLLLQGDLSISSFLATSLQASIERDCQLQGKPA
tara:strand:- start:42 stop:224 length:183 start_codon:yes stop_codon:yes gene_type:complete